jgi:hypothetical protein
MVGMMGEDHLVDDDDDYDRALDPTTTALSER